MPTIFILAFVAFVVLVLAFVLVMVFVFGARPSHDSNTDFPPGSGFNNPGGE